MHVKFPHKNMLVLMPSSVPHKIYYFPNVAPETEFNLSLLDFKISMLAPQS